MYREHCTAYHFKKKKKRYVKPNVLCNNKQLQKVVYYIVVTWP